jgi:hypothetical protein
MSRGLSALQRQLLEHLSEVPEGHGVKTEQLAQRVGRFQQYALEPEPTRAQVAQVIHDNANVRQLKTGDWVAEYLSRDDRFTVYRALRSLQRRGLADRFPVKAIIHWSLNANGRALAASQYQKASA